MPPRTHVCRVFVVTAAVAIGCSRSATVELRPIPGQNVLLVTIDTLRADALGCYGGPARTPAIDQLAAGGVRFDFAHAHAVTTLASHASIVTGTYPFQHGIHDNSGYRLDAASRTVATLLKPAGYATAAFLAAFPLHARFGLNQGFDVYDDRFGDTRAPDHIVMPERPAPAVIALARNWIAQHGAGGAGAEGRGTTASADRPWFVWVHLFDPHAPYRPPPPFDVQYSAQPYYGEVAATDAALAPLLDDVRASARPTLVVVTGDHGEALGDHGEQTHGLFAYESTLRIPLIIAEAGHSVVAGDVSSAPARHVDIVPTILDAIGQTVPPDLPGRTLLTSAARRDPAPRASYFEAMSAMLNRGWAPLTGVVADRDKYIDLPIAERYDLAVDPREQANLAGRSAERDRMLAATLRGFQAPAPGERRAENAEAAARLQALGYVTGHAPQKTRYAEADDPKTLVEIDRDVHDALEAFTSGRPAAAVQIYQRVIERRPDMAMAYRHLAFVERQRGNAAGAIDALRRAIAAGVRDSRVVGQLGEYLTETGHVAEGIRLLESVANSDSSDLDALNALGIAYAQSGRGGEARAIFERVLAVNPGSSVPLENLGLLALERGDTATARRRFARAVQADPRSSRAHAGLGTVALRAGDRKGAMEAWTRAVQLDAKNFDALYNLGTALARDGNLTAARPYLEQFLRTAPPAFYAKDLKEVTALLAK
jgi:arylsulfatase A-like enzyme/Tfp pilus assembly protein PilF